MIKSPLRYPGGKSRAISLISKLVPEFGEFREPFVGGGSLFIYLKQIYPHKRFWINDLYEPLFKFWSICQKQLNEVIAQISKWRKQFSEGKSLHRYLTENYSQFNDIEKASAFFILNRITFSGTSDSGGYSEQAFRNRFTLSSIERLKKLEEILPGTIITNFDYEEVVKTKGDNVFIFLDPPYYSTSKSALYGKNGNLHKSFNHEHFADVMHNCSHKWLITYDDSKFIRKIFSFANIISWDLTYGMRNVTSNSNQIGKELFISNYLKESRRDLKADNFSILQHSLKF
ncbi:MAG: DNA adenine methylase [Candidatus Omnitrophica bacterium]|nr:DNA adenine methylase [Candidatus Omnitrophota bacterium]